MISEPDFYVNDDYAGCAGGNWSFYYGYEEQTPHDPEKDERGEWQFVAKRGDKEWLRATAKELGMEQFDNPENVLLKGIATVMFNGASGD